THGYYRFGASVAEDAAVLALAGANHGAEGLLTDRELAAVDLRETQLVTLSACDTAMGIASYTDGLLGFHRALAIAGSRSQLLSLWKVNDVATREFMQAFYAELVKGESKSEALRRVQLDFIHRDRPPAEWAAFELFGDPGPLQSVEAREPR